MFSNKKIFKKHPFNIHDSDSIQHYVEKKN